MNVAIIPARGGSKRIPRKNIKIFHGKPIIAWSINAALKSQCFDKVIVSTDDNEIAEISTKLGAEVPFLRPQALSDDYTGTTEVVNHAIQWHLDHNFNIKYACCIYATAPFLTHTDLQESYKILKSSNSKYVFSVTDYEFPIQRALRINNNSVEMFYPNNFKTRSQDLEKAYHDAGQFYWGTAQAWLDKEILFSNVSTPFILPRNRVQDIDTIEDWKYAELLYQINMNS